MTATATDSLKALTGEAIVDFSLPHFLSSKYAPKVEYHTITNHSISKKQTEKIQSKLKYIKNIKKHSKKKSEVKYLANMLNNVLSEIDSDDVLITDLKSRIENIQEEKTIIFVPSIQKANEIEHKINALYDHKNLSIAYHSETKHK
jgi:superfamily II DNA or RNA helicase